jgi:membrane peptidoglycan carboxypeptidase
MRQLRNWGALAILRRWQRSRRSGLIGWWRASPSTGGFLSGCRPSISCRRLAFADTRITDRNGRLLYEIIDPKGGRHTAVQLARIPVPLRQATIATEDRNFYSTPGVDVEGVLRALWINLQGGEVRAGGSTITQQVARTLLLDPEQRASRTLQRKLREMVLAVRLSQTYSHDDIPALYLNQCTWQTRFTASGRRRRSYSGAMRMRLIWPNAPCWPVAAASRPVRSAHQSRRGQDRQKVVLGLMVDAGHYPAQADAAASFAIRVRISPSKRRILSSSSEPVAASPGSVYQGGLTVKTTLDLDWQHAAEDIARRHIDELNHPPAGEEPHSASDASLVALDPHTGQVLALLGSVDYFDESISGAVNMAIAPRQPGSALKPFTYALSFDPRRPDPWTPATMILDVSTPFITRRLQSYTPANYGLVEHGPVLIREALASSYNIPAVVALDHVGLDALLNLLHRLGMTTLNDPSRLDLSVTLGGGEVRLMELAAAYAAFANNGVPVQPSLILEVQDKTGATLYQWQPPLTTDPVIDPRVTYLISDILSDNDARLPSFGNHSALAIGRPGLLNRHDNRLP